jgi:hypothetical protein
MTLIPWKRGKCLVWDFTCVDTFASSYLNNTLTWAGAAAEMADEKKRNKYNFYLDRFLFVPVAVETSGVWGKECLKVIKETGLRLATVTKDYISTTFLLQRISIAVQRENVAAILGNLPPGKELDEIFLFKLLKN